MQVQFGIQNFFTSVEVKSGNARTKKFANDSRNTSLILSRCQMLNHNGSIYLFNGQECLTLEQGSWKHHSTSNAMNALVVSTDIGIFMFHLFHYINGFSYEYLLNGQRTWNYPDVNDSMPGSFRQGSAIYVKSKQEIWLIGGQETERRILTFDIKSFTFEELPLKLNIGRFGHRCEIIPGTSKIMITGGQTFDLVTQCSTEILDPETLSITIASPMNRRRSEHGMSVVTINDEDRLAVFGGFEDNFRDLRCFELYNTKTQKWELTKEISLRKGKRGFGYLSVRNEMISKYLN